MPGRVMLLVAALAGVLPRGNTCIGKGRLRSLATMASALAASECAAEGWTADAVPTPATRMVAITALRQRMRKRPMAICWYCRCRLARPLKPS